MTVAFRWLIERINYVMDVRKERDALWEMAAMMREHGWHSLADITPADALTYCNFTRLYEKTMGVGENVDMYCKTASIMGALERLHPDLVLNWEGEDGDDAEKIDTNPDDILKK